MTALSPLSRSDTPRVTDSEAALGVWWRGAYIVVRQGRVRVRSDEEVCVPLPDYAIRSGPRNCIFFQPEKVDLPVTRPERLLRGS